MINVGLVGYGYWGPNLVRNFVESADAHMAKVCDMNTARLKAVQARYPGVEVTARYEDLIGDTGIDAVVIATPVSTHFGLAMQALQADKHVLVEKPITAKADEARQLIDEAERRKKVLMVDHTFIYTGAVRKIKELVDAKEVGDIYYYDSTRINLGLFQHDVNVLWDLAVHDLSIMGHILADKPRAVSATGISHIEGRPENTAYLTVFFDSKVIAHIHANWLAPVKIRQTIIGGSNKMVVYDDLEPSEKIKVYDKGITLDESPESVYNMRIGYRAGDMWAPQLDMTEALQAEVGHFIDCIEGGTKPMTDGEAGLQIVKILEAGTASMKEHGKMMELQ